MTTIRKQLPIAGFDGQDEWNERIRCNWEDCSNPASGLHERRVCHAARKHSPRELCNLCERKCFCSEGHADFWSRSHRPGQYGRNSAGVAPMYVTVRK